MIPHVGHPTANLNMRQFIPNLHVHHLTDNVVVFAPKPATGHSLIDDIAVHSGSGSEGDDSEEADSDDEDFLDDGDDEIVVDSVEIRAMYQRSLLVGGTMTFDSLAGSPCAVNQPPGMIDAEANASNALLSLAQPSPVPGEDPALCDF